MAMSKQMLISAALGALFLLAGCAEESKPSDAEDVKREARELAEALESYSADQRDEAVAEAQRALADLNERVEALRARISERWNDMDEAAREQAEENLEILDNEQGQLAERFEALRSASGDAWARLREGFSDAYSELRDAWQEADRAVAE